MIWIVVVVVGISTFAMRFVFIALFGVVTPPVWLERTQRYIAPAVLAALALPAVAAPGGAIDPINPFIPAAIVGGLAAWRSRSIGGAIAIGLPVLWLILWLT